MLRKTLVTLAVVALSVVSANAELKYTLRTSIQKTATPAGPANPMFAGLGEMMVKQLSPNGPMEMTVVIGDKGSRTEFPKDGFGPLAGAVMLLDPNGGIILLNDRDKTYIRETADLDEAAAALAALGVQAKSSHRRTREFATIAGVRAERVTFEWSMPLPVPDDQRAKLPADFPKEISMSGDMWVASGFKQYAALAARSNQSLAMLGLDKLMQEGLVMKSVVRSTMFHGFQIESVVTSIAEAPVPASMFDIPAGYRKISAPRR